MAKRTIKTRTNGSTFEIPDDQYAKSATTETVTDTKTESKPITDRKAELLKQMEEFSSDAPTVDKPETEPRGRKKREDKSKVVIPGRLFLGVCDRLSASGIGMLDAMLSNDPIDPRILMLDQQGKDDLLPLAQEALKELKLEENPVQAFFLSLFIGQLTMYGTIKAMEARDKKIKLKKENEDGKKA